MSEQPTIRVGQIWREVDPRVTRFIRIEAVYPNDASIRKVTRSRVNELWEPAYGSGVRLARIDRFNGKRGGYALHEDI